MRNLDLPFLRCTLSLEKKMQERYGKCLQLLAGLLGDKHLSRRMQLEVNGSLSVGVCRGSCSLGNSKWTGHLGSWAVGQKSNGKQTKQTRLLHLGVGKTATTRGQPHLEMPSRLNKAARPKVLTWGSWLRGKCCTTWSPGFNTWWGRRLRQNLEPTHSQAGR